MLRFLLIPLLYYALPTHACICETRPLEESIKKASFIAHVKITYEPKKIDTSLRLDKTWIPLSHSVVRTIQIIELFKGDSVKKLTEYGVNSSCELGLYPGQEWIVFAYYDQGNKIYSVSACSASRQLRNAQGEQGLGYWSGDQSILQFLRKYFDHTSGTKYDSGKFKSYYANGQIEWEASYTNSQLDGNRKIYFANGVLWQNENYKGGEKEGVQQRYARSGQLLDETNYIAGKIDRVTYWHDTSYFERSMAIMFESFSTDKRKNDSILLANPPVIQKSIEAFYYPDGSYYSKKYSRTGWLEQELFRYDSSGTNITCGYDQSGKLIHEAIITKYNDHTTEKKWNEKGDLISHKEWENGKFLGDKLVR